MRYQTKQVEHMNQADRDELRRILGLLGEASSALEDLIETVWEKAANVDDYFPDSPLSEALGEQSEALADALGDLEACIDALEGAL